MTKLIKIQYQTNLNHEPTNSSQGNIIIVAKEALRNCSNVLYCSTNIFLTVCKTASILYSQQCQMLTCARSNNSLFNIKH
uniref:Uncharacterized protein n=1 Tax=Arundo donax TaxID=35708 RepID=A0A0A9EFA0_ARUDO